MKFTDVRGGKNTAPKHAIITANEIYSRNKIWNLPTRFVYSITMFESALSIACTVNSHTFDGGNVDDGSSGSRFNFSYWLYTSRALPSFPNTSYASHNPDACHQVILTSEDSVNVLSMYKQYLESVHKLSALKLNPQIRLMWCTRSLLLWYSSFQTTCAFWLVSLCANYIMQLWCCRTQNEFVFDEAMKKSHLYACGVRSTHLDRLEIKMKHKITKGSLNTFLTHREELNGILRLGWCYHTVYDTLDSPFVQLHLIRYPAHAKPTKNSI